MAVLRFDRGTLLLEGFTSLPPAPFEFDPRVEAYRAPAISYPEVIRVLRDQIRENRAPAYGKLELEFTPPHTLYPHQQAALTAWKRAGGRGLVVLPTGAGKSLVGLSAIAWASRSALVVVPTLDLMHQWYAHLRAAFPGANVGLIGGGYHEVTELAVATYDSAAIHAEKLGNRYGTLVFDEVHHLPTDFYRAIALFSLAPYRLGLTATPERADLRHEELPELVGPLVYRRHAAELQGDVLAEYRIERIYTDLSLAERQAYHQALEERNRFLDEHGLGLGTLQGWQRFVMVSARSEAGRRAMRAHREAGRIAAATPGKLRALEVILARHAGEKILIFTADNDTAYAVSRAYLVPCLTHQTRVKERQEFLERFRDGTYRAIVTSKVLNEGVDVPDASVGVVLSGSSVPRELVQRLGRILRRSEGKRAVLYEIIARETREERVSERRREGVRLDPGGSGSRLENTVFSDQPILWDDLGED